MKSPRYTRVQHAARDWLCVELAALCHEAEDRGLSLRQIAAQLEEMAASCRADAPVRKTKEVSP